MARGDSHIDRVIRSVTSGTAAAQSRLAASWQRSFQKHGLDPSRPLPSSRPDTLRLSERREELGRMLRLAGPRLDDLYAMLGHCGCGVLLTDAQGLVLDSRSGSGDASRFAAWGLHPGVDWSEAAQGTNGIGTCLAEMRPVTIHRDQHYLARNIGMSCIDAPVFGPEGQLVAALDVSSARADQTEGFNRLIEGMVVRVARQIESDLFRAAHSAHRIVLAPGEDPADTALLAVDGDELVVGATREARRRFGLERDGSLRPRPLVDLTGSSQESGSGLDRAERAALVRALARADGNASEAARALGIGRATLYRRMKRLDIPHRQP